MTAITSVELLRRIHDSFDAVGAKDPTGSAASSIAAALLAAGRIDVGVAVDAIPSGFLARNGVPSEFLAKALAENLGRAELAATHFPLLVGPEDIDSFDRVREVDPRDVASLVYPLPLLEDDIKRALLTILGEPFDQRHSGSELSDIFTTRVRLGGRQRPSAFMLKGRGLAGVLRAKNAGDSGNQVTKLARTGVDLFVVQHVNEIDMDVRAQLTHAVAYQRLRGSPEAVGSVWDGADTARVLSAYGFLKVTEEGVSIDFS